MAYSINAYFGEIQIGELKQDPHTGLLNFQYSTQWQKAGFNLSPALQINQQCKPTSVYNYIDNQLPEGEARKLLALDLGVSEKQLFAQIKAIGRDLAGAITFATQNHIFDTPIFRPISEQEMVERLNNKEQYGLLYWDEKPRLSVAGVQDKLNVFVNSEGEIGLADGRLCSTHILKFERKNTPNLVLNEYICMKLSKAIGLPTAEVRFLKFANHPALLVTRFDRKYDAKQQRVYRRHIIDGCQALDLPRDNKYERNLGDGRDVKHIRDGASLEKLFNLCRNSNQPIKNMHWLINWQLFNLIINNYDSHGKNVSFYYGKNEFEFTPSYDLVNVAMFDEFKHVLAMGMGEEFEPSCINAYQLADFAEVCQIDKKLITRLLKKQLKAVKQALTDRAFISDIFDTQSTLFTSNDGVYADELISQLIRNIEHFSKQAELITSIEV